MEQAEKSQQNPGASTTRKQADTGSRRQLRMLLACNKYCGGPLYANMINQCKTQNPTHSQTWLSPPVRGNGLRWLRGSGDDPAGRVTHGDPGIKTMINPAEDNCKKQRKPNETIPKSNAILTKQSDS